MRGDFNQLSVRNVRAEICARDLAGASGACVTGDCVILSVLAASLVSVTPRAACQDKPAFPRDD
jgi:hypothetical protein